MIVKIVKNEDRNQLTVWSELIERLDAAIRERDNAVSREWEILGTLGIMRKRMKLYEEAIQEAEKILVNDYTMIYGPFFDLVKKAQTLST